MYLLKAVTLIKFDQKDHLRRIYEIKQKSTGSNSTRWHGCF